MKGVFYKLLTNYFNSHVREPPVYVAFKHAALASLFLASVYVMVVVPPLLYVQVQTRSFLQEAKETKATTAINNTFFIFF